jgi:Peptidase family M28
LEQPSAEPQTLPHPIVLLVALAIASLLTVISLKPPVPLPADAPEGSFSATRAVRELARVLTPQVPHPLSSPAHDVVRDHIVGRFRELGYDTAVENTFACSANKVCAPLENIIASRPGDPAGPAVALTAHYDSVPAGPGASDDGTGVATLLEIARAVRHDAPRHPIRFVVTDGEEAGLLGAEGFAADAPASSSVAAVINVDNRGTAGASFLFETSRNNRRLIPLMARSLPRPTASSLFFDIYEMLPNDTDMSVFKRAGKIGLNFGNIDGASHYHTPSDDLERVTAATVQHHGANALAAARALANSDLALSQGGNDVYFDVFQRHLFWWPHGLTPWLEAAIGLMILVSCVFLVRAGRASPGGIALSIVWMLVALFVAAASAAAISALLRTHHDRAVWVAYPFGLLSAAWACGLMVALLGAIMARRWASFDSGLLGTAIGWLAAAVAATIFLPGASYLLVIPGAGLSIGAILRSKTRLRADVATLLGAVPAVVLLLPFGIFFYVAIGDPIVPGVAATMALVATSFMFFLAPAPPRSWSWLAAGVVVIVSSIAVDLARPPYSAESPRRLNLSYVVDADARKAVWATPLLSPAIRKAASFGEKGEVLSPWFRRPVPSFVAPAPMTSVPAPELSSTDELRGNQRHVTVRLHSVRRASRLLMMMHSGSPITGIRVNGVAPPTAARFSSAQVGPGWYRVVVAASEATVDFTGPRTPIDVVLIDISFAFPSQGDALVAARNSYPGTTSDDGDVTQVRRRLKI